jgi:hypothetical protein
MSHVAYQLAVSVLDLLQKRDSADLGFWDYRMLTAENQPMEVEEVARLHAQNLCDHDTCPVTALLAHETSGDYHEMFVLMDDGRVLWLPETRWDAHVQSLGGVAQTYGLWIGTPAQLEALFDEQSYP